MPLSFQPPTAGSLRLFRVALAGIGLSVGAFTGLLASEHTPLFGFMEHGYRLEVIVALGAEAAATASLTAFLACIARWTPRLVGTSPPRGAVRA